MKFLLSRNESFICLLVKANISKDGCCNKGSNLVNLNNSYYTDGSTIIDVVGLVSTTLGILICSRYILKALVRVDSESKSGRLFIQSNL